MAAASGASTDPFDSALLWLLGDSFGASSIFPWWVRQLFFLVAAQKLRIKDANVSALGAFDYIRTNNVRGVRSKRTIGLFLFTHPPDARTDREE